MKAAVYHRYGAPSVVAIADLPTPTPKDNELLIRIEAATVSSGDWRARTLDLPPGFGLIGRLVFGVFGPRKPVLGTELSGVVEAVGAAVTRFKAGDKVFASPGARMGAHAEYITMAEDGLVAPMPENLSFEEAAALSFGGTTALSFLRDKGGIKPGDKLLVVGASGAVGSAAVQIGKALGAEVTGVSSGANADLVRSLGADHVIDYTREDFTRSGETYDLILNANGTVKMAAWEGSLKPGGRLLLVLGSFAQSLGLDKPAKGSGKQAIAGVAAVTVESLRFLAELAKAGKFMPVIDRIYPLESIVEAHAYVESGRKRGNVVLRMGHGES